MRELTRCEVAATYHFHDRYAAQALGAIDFWQTLSKSEKDFIQRMVHAIILAAS